MKVKVPPRLAARLAPPVVGTLASTWRYHLEGDFGWRELVAARRPLVIVLWHDMLLPLLWQHRHQEVSIVVSEARDGQYLADYAARLGFGAVRGSTTRGGLRALLGAVRTLEGGGKVAFTPDGPRGPRRVMTPGAVVAAQRAGAHVIPLHASATPAWRLNSWDRFCIPRPFARVRVGYGAPVTVAPGPAGLEAGVAAVTAAMAALERDLDA